MSKLHMIRGLRKKRSGRDGVANQVEQRLVKPSRLSLWRCRRGSVALMVGLMAPVLFMMLALSIEIASWALADLDLQRAADVAAWAGATQYATSSSAQTATSVAADVAEINGVAGAPPTRSWNSTTLMTTDNLITAQLVTGLRNSGDKAIKVTAQKIINKTFAGIFPSAQGAVTVTAVAVAEVLPAPSCVVALSTSASDAIDVNNGGAITATQCAVTSNSSSSTAIYVAGGSISGTSVNAAGGFSVSNGGTVSPSETANAAAAANPYAALTAPTAGSCSYTNASFATADTAYAFTQSANVFCGNTTIGGNASTDTFAPGIYYVTNGNLTFNNATVTTASGVSFVLTGTSPGAVTWTNNSTAPTTITAPTTGATAGIVFWQTCPSSGTAPANSMAGSAYTLYLSGAFYAPCGALNISNGVTLANVSGDSMNVVALTVSVVGGGAIDASPGSGSGAGSVTIALVQ